LLFSPSFQGYFQQQRRVGGKMVSVILVKVVTLGLNLLTMYAFDQYNRDHFPTHTSLLLEITLEGGRKKQLWLEKNNCINLSENFLITNSLEMKHLKKRNKNNSMTIRQMLETTQQRLGTQRFFNWHWCENNCQRFTKEILKSLHQWNSSTKPFLMPDKSLQLMVPSELSLHIANCLCVLYNMVEKYLIG
jgi:hypothetical protein